MFWGVLGIVMAYIMTFWMLVNVFGIFIVFMVLYVVMLSLLPCIMLLGVRSSRELWRIVYCILALCFIRCIMRCYLCGDSV